MPLTLHKGLTIGKGITFGAGTGGGGGGGGTGSITYEQMPGPVAAGYIESNLQDPSATVNNPVGFTINDSDSSGVFANALTAENITYFDNLGPGTYTATLGAGSTYNTISVNVVTIPSEESFAQLVWLFDPAETYPATFNYPITIS